MAIKIIHHHGFTISNLEQSLIFYRDGQRVARAMYALDPDGISVEMFQEYGDIISR